MIAPDLVQLQADLAEIASDFDRIRQQVAVLVERQRKQEAPQDSAPTDRRGFVTDGDGTHVRED